jgi:hypothetical protein
LADQVRLAALPSIWASAAAGACVVAHPGRRRSRRLFDAGHLKEHRNSRILPIDRAVANEWGRLNANRPLPVIDGLLAATAKIHRLTLVTRNIADIADLGVHILNPFEPRLALHAIPQLSRR